MHTTVLRGPRRWPEVEGAWRSILDGREVRWFSQLPELAEACSTHAHDDRTRWVVVEDGDGPLAVLPFVLGVRRIGPLRLRVLANDRGLDAMVAARARPADLRAAVLGALARDGDPVDVLSLNGMRPHSGFLRLAAAGPSGLRAEAQHGGNSIIDTRLPGDEWFAASGRNLRASLRKARNRFTRRGAMTIADARTPDEVAAAFDDFVAVEATGWKAESEALANSPVDRALHHHLLLACAADGRAWARTLRLDERPAAVQLGIVAGRTLALLKVAYDDELADLSPSNLLMADLVRACCDSPEIDRIDLVTNQPWHDRWHADEVPTYQARDVDLRRPGGVVARLATTAEGARARLARP